MAQIQEMSHDQATYYVPHGSHWPIVGSFGLLFTVGGAALWLDEVSSGQYIMFGGIALLIFMMFGWFGTVIRESLKGYYNKQVDTSFRMGMMWFIFSEVMFFAAFFGALFYARTLSVPWLGGEGHGALTNYYLWPNFSPAWPTNGPADIGGEFNTMAPWGIPLLNTLLLLSSGRDDHDRAPRAARRQSQAAADLPRTHGHPRLRVPRLPGARVHRGVYEAQPHARQRRLRLDVLHADRLPRSACDARRDHADRDPGFAARRATSRRITTSRSRRWPGIGTSSTVVWLGLFMFVYVL